MTNFIVKEWKGDSESTLIYLSLQHRGAGQQCASVWHDPRQAEGHLSSGSLSGRYPHPLEGYCLAYIPAEWMQYPWGLLSHSLLLFWLHAGLWASCVGSCQQLFESTQEWSLMPWPHNSQDLSTPGWPLAGFWLHVFSCCNSLWDTPLFSSCLADRRRPLRDRPQSSLPTSSSPCVHLGLCLQSRCAVSIWSPRHHE